MATAGGDMNRTVLVPDAQAGQTVAYTGTAGSVTFQPGPRKVAVLCTTFAYVKVGGTATASDLPVPANTLVVLPVDTSVGGTFVVSAIQVASGGNLHVKPLAA